MTDCVWGEREGDVEDAFHISGLDGWTLTAMLDDQFGQEVSALGGGGCEEFCLGHWLIRHSDGEVYKNSRG